jgi:hypothetical protein
MVFICCFNIIYKKAVYFHGGAFILRTDAGNIILKKNNKGIPYLNLKEFEAEAVLSLVQTVQGNMEGFTKREVRKRERLARRKEC